MTNRIIYFISLLVVFVLTLSTYILARFTHEEKFEETQRYISKDIDLLIELHPSVFFREALLKPLFSQTLSSEDRLIFEIEREIIPSEPTGISFLSPVYLTTQKIDGKTLYALYFALNSAQDFALFSKKQSTINSTLVFHHAFSTGVIAYAPSIPIEKIRAHLHSVFDQPTNPSLIFTDYEKHTVPPPIQIHSIAKGKVDESINLIHQLSSNKIDFSGKIALTYPIIKNKINPLDDGLYISFALSDELKTFFYPTIKSFISEENWNHITGIELNYAGVKINPKTRQPEPKLNIHLHHTSDTLFDPLAGLPKQWIDVNTEKGTVTMANNTEYTYTKSDGLFTLENLSYTWRETTTASNWEIIGNPSTLFNIDEPFKSMALAFDPKLRGLNRLVEQINWLSSKASPKGNKLTINQEVEFRKGTNPYFELFYCIRKIAE